MSYAEEIKHEMASPITAKLEPKKKGGTEHAHN